MRPGLEKIVPWRPDWVPGEVVPNAGGARMVRATLNGDGSYTVGNDVPEPPADLPVLSSLSGDYPDMEGLGQIVRSVGKAISGVAKKVAPVGIGLVTGGPAGAAAAAAAQVFGQGGQPPQVATVPGPNGVMVQVPVAPQPVPAPVQSPVLLQPPAAQPWGWSEPPAAGLGGLVQGGGDVFAMAQAQLMAALGQADGMAAAAEWQASTTGDPQASMAAGASRGFADRIRDFLANLARQVEGRARQVGAAADAAGRAVDAAEEAYGHGRDAVDPGYEPSRVDWGSIGLGAGAAAVLMLLTMNAGGNRGEH